MNDFGVEGTRPRGRSIVAREHRGGEQTLPYRGLDISGRATLSRDGFHEVVRRTAARYIAPESADAFAAGYKEPNMVIRLVPDRIRAWDFRDDLESSA